MPPAKFNPETDTDRPLVTVNGKTRRLTWLQEAFCQAYVQDPTNNTLAVRKAGYKGNNNSQRRTALRMLNDDYIRLRIAQIRAKTKAECQIDVKWWVAKCLELLDEAQAAKDRSAANGLIKMLGKHLGSFEADNNQKGAETLASLAREMLLHADRPQLTGGSDIVDAEVVDADKV